MCTGDLPLSTKEVVASLVKIPHRYVFLTFPDVLQQSGSSKCGLYSLAFAETLCQVKDPAMFKVPTS